MHEILYRLWTQWETSLELHRKTDQEINIQLNQVSLEVLDEWSIYHPILRGNRYRLIERSRLVKLLGEWILQEKQRAIVVHQVIRKETLWGDKALLK